MTNQQQKKQLWENTIKPAIIKEIGDKYEISVIDMNRDDKYFHPAIKLDNDFFIQAQCDLETDYYYACYLYSSNASYIRINLNTNSLKDALKLIKQRKIRKTIKDEMQEIKILSKQLNIIQELISAKKELLNSYLLRR